jgi:uncharacterized heparinase superfamily protein
VARDALAGRFSFHGTTRELGIEVDWYRADLDEGTRLWKTLLHEFSYGIDLARAARSSGDSSFSERLENLLASWSGASPIGLPGFARDVWNARAVSTRLVNWAVAASILDLRPEDPSAALLRSQLAVHAVFLRDNLELDLRGNHLLRDYVGLIFADALLGSSPDALGMLRAELAEQVLPDGCHVERSPLYHAVVLQDLIECRALLGAETPDWLEDAIARMAGFLAHLLPPSGDLPLLGDSWRGEIAPGRILEEAGNGTPPMAGVPERSSGLVVLRRGGTHAIIRAGAHGPDYQLGHAHADGLSFELYRGRSCTISDTGTGTYDAGPSRSRIRSTAAHNTLQLDGQEQLEAWGSFRVGRRGRGRVRDRGSNDHWEWVWGIHDGYRWLPGRPIHQRLLAVSDEAVIALDTVTGAGRHRIRNAIHLHPDLPSDWGEIAALRGEVQRIEVPLHERFNDCRPMTELFVEDESQLPWLGGWALIFEPAEAPAQIELRETGSGVVLHWDRGSRAIELNWDLEGGAVEIEYRIATGSERDGY